MKNTIIAGNFDLDTTASDRPDLSVPSVVGFTSEGYSFIGINTGASTLFPSGDPNTNDDYVGTSSLPLVANLSPLQNNQGPTLTHTPTATATELVDQGNCSSEGFDQRGNGGNITIPIRIQDVALANASDGCDIGAVEVGAQAIQGSVDLKILLDGPYENVLMNTDLNVAGLIPDRQPYNVAPWNYNGGESLNSIPSDMVDWILVEIQTGGPMSGLTTVATRALPLEDNGDLFLPDTLFPIRPLSGVFYFTFHHRNHLSVTTASPVEYDWGQTMQVDLTNSLSSAYSQGGTAMRNRDGKFTMWGGDGDKDGSISAFDFLNIWLPANGGAAAYANPDFNMDGSATAFDFLDVWLASNGQSSQSPD